MFIRKFKEKNNLGMKPEVLATVAQFSFVLYIILSRMDIPQLSFIEGILLGLSIVGNLAWMIKIRKKGGN